MRKHLPIILLLGLTAVVFTATSFQPSLANDIDASHAIAAREMVQRHDWITLHINGVRYLEKAPLLYWLVATCYQIFGFNEFAVRLPTIVSIVLLVGVTYLFGIWAYSRKAGLYAAAVLATCFGMFLFTRMMIPEALLTFWLTVAHLCFLQGFWGKGKAKRFYYGFYAAMAMAVLSKGLIGIVFSIGPVALFLLLTGNLAVLKEMRLLAGTGVFLAIAAPWHIAQALKNDNFFWFYFINEHVLRFLNVREQRDYNRLPMLQYWLFHLFWWFPWCVGLPLLVQQLPSLKMMHRVGQASPPVSPSSTSQQASQPTSKLPSFPASTHLYLALWAGLILIFFGLSSNQEYYTFPAYPAIALLLGQAFATAEEKTPRMLLWLQGLLAAISLLFATILAALVWSSRNVRATGDISKLIEQAAADSVKYTRSLGHLFDLTPIAFAELRGPAIAAALTVGIGFLVALWFRYRQQHGLTLVAMVLTMNLLFICANRAHTVFEPILSSRSLAEEINRRWQPGDQIVINGNHEIGSSIQFYTDRQVLLLNGRKFNLEYGSRFPDAPPVFIENEDLRQLWRGPHQVFLYTEDVKKAELLKTLGLPATEIGDRGGRSVLTNRP